MNDMALRRYLINGARALRLPITPQQADQLGAYVTKRAAADAPPPIALSPQRRAVLIAMADGETTESTAQRLAISAHTVKTHRGHLLRQLGANSAAHAVAIGYELGLLRASSAPGATVGGAP